jgi:hypothetical protein
MRKMKKFSEGGKTSRAQGKMDRRMADIDKDYKRALAKGKSEKEARAKRAQREADARDDFAKRTGADRTATRAAEKAAEARLTAARRSPDKDMKPVSVASTPSAMTKIDMPKVETAAVGKKGYDDMSFRAAFAQAMKDKGKGETFTWKGKSYKLETAGSAPKQAAAPARNTAAPARNTAAPARNAATTIPRGRSTPGLSSEEYTRAVNTGTIPANASAEDRANIRATIKAKQDAKYNRPATASSASTAPKQGYVAGSSRPAQARGFAKGGKANKLPSQNYLAERLRKAAEGPENRSAESLQRGAIGRANREQAREANIPKRAKGGVMKKATKAGKAMVKKSADTMGRAMVKKYAKGGTVGKADGCATKGKTKTKMVTMAMGGMAGYKRGGKTC